MKTNNIAVMTIRELLNIRLDANSVTNMLQYLKESNERAKKTGVYKTHSLISIRDLISICRNSYLQKMFGFIGYVERAGSGADTILQGWKENHWPKPQIRELYDPEQVELTLYFNSLDPRNDPKNEPKPDTKRDTNKLTDRQRLIYNIIAAADTNGDTDNDTNRMTPTGTSIADAVKVSLSTVKRELDKMKDMGVIKRVGPSFGGHWEIIKK